MKLKRYSLIALISGVFISVIGFLMPLIYWSSYTSQNGAIGIIGGVVDTPKYIFMLSSLFDGLPFVLVILGISLVVAASNDSSSCYGGGNGTNLATNPDSGTVG